MRPRKQISTAIDGGRTAGIERVLVGPEVFAHPRRALTEDDAIGQWIGRSAVDAEARVIVNEQAGILAAVLRTMHPRRAAVLVRYYAGDQTLSRIADDLSISRSRAQQILRRAIWDVEDTLRSVGVLARTSPPISEPGEIERRRADAAVRARQMRPVPDRGGLIEWAA